MPDYVLLEPYNAHKQLHQLLMEEQKPDAVFSLTSGVFKPYLDVCTAVFLFNSCCSLRAMFYLYYSLYLESFLLLFLLFEDPLNRESTYNGSLAQRMSRAYMYNNSKLQILLSCFPDTTLDSPESLCLA